LATGAQNNGELGAAFVKGGEVPGEAGEVDAKGDLSLGLPVLVSRGCTGDTALDDMDRWEEVGLPDLRLPPSMIGLPALLRLASE
jgi:hypothetical protein